MGISSMSSSLVRPMSPEQESFSVISGRMMTERPHASCRCFSFSFLVATFFFVLTFFLEEADEDRLLVLLPLLLLLFVLLSLLLFGGATFSSGEFFSSSAEEGDTNAYIASLPYTQVSIARVNGEVIQTASFGNSDKNLPNSFACSMPSFVNRASKIFGSSQLPGPEIASLYVL